MIRHFVSYNDHTICSMSTTHPCRLHNNGLQIIVLGYKFYQINLGNEENVNIRTTLEYICVFDIVVFQIKLETWI